MCLNSDCNELVSASPACFDYSPFPSKFYALAYMLVHILCQGEANLKFVFFVMHQFDKSIPSISSIKQFLLPGMNPPRQALHN